QESHAGGRRSVPAAGPRAPILATKDSHRPPRLREVAMTAAVAPRREPVPVHLLGAPDSGCRELFQLLSEKYASVFKEAGVPLSLCDLTEATFSCGPVARTVSVWTVDATFHAATTTEERLKDLVALLKKATAMGGHECAIGGCPLFLVLTG